MEFVTLGTAGGPVPLKHRAQPAHAVISGERTILAVSYTHLRAHET